MKKSKTDDSDSEILGRARELIDPTAIYPLFNGTNMECFTGTQLIQTAEATLEFMKAIKSGDSGQIHKALEGLMKDD